MAWISRAGFWRLAAPSLLACFLLIGGCDDDADDDSTVYGPLPEPGFVLIEPGTFMMGRPERELGRAEDEILHEVTLTNGFYLCDHEVTQSEWHAVMGWNNAYFRGSDLPVEQVTWFDAVAYCNARSVREGLVPAYTIAAPLNYLGDHLLSAVVTWDTTATGYRLPTEAEWEYACRAGTTTAFSNGPISVLYCEPDPSLTEVGWYCYNSLGQTREIMGKQPNDWGLYDMHGNVSEWCWDAYEKILGFAPVTNPMGHPTNVGRVRRGGGWYRLAPNCRAAERVTILPGNRFYDMGLRVARTRF